MSDTLVYAADTKVNTVFVLYWPRDMKEKGREGERETEKE